MDIIDRLRFDAARSEAQFSKGVASNIEEAATEIERLRAALEDLVDANFDADAQRAGAALERAREILNQQRPPEKRK